MTAAEDHKRGVAEVFDRAAATYDEVIPYFATFGRHLVSLAGLRPGDAVLDIGCGRGAVTLPAAEAVGERGRVEAIDLAPAMVSLLSATAPPNVTVAVGDAESPAFPDASFDAVLSGFVVTFLPDPAAALAAYRRLLGEGGTLGLSTFPAQPDTKWSRVGDVVRRHLAGPPPGGRPDQSPANDPARLAELVREAGFAQVRQDTEPHEIAFRDLDQWWAWVWSQGTRAMLERVPPESLDALKAELYDLLGADVPDGEPVTLTQYVTYTLATT